MRRRQCGERQADLREQGPAHDHPPRYLEVGRIRRLRLRRAQPLIQSSDPSTWPCLWSCCPKSMIAMFNEKCRLLCPVCLCCRLTRCLRRRGRRCGARTRSAAPRRAAPPSPSTPASTRRAAATPPSTPSPRGSLTARPPRTRWRARCGTCSGSASGSGCSTRR